MNLWHYLPVIDSLLSATFVGGFRTSGVVLAVLAQNGEGRGMAADASWIGVLTQGVITTGVLGSAWLTNRVWKGKKSREAAADSKPVPVAVSRNFDDPTTPAGYTIRRLEGENRELTRQLTEARDQVVDYAVNNARLKAEKVALEEDKDDLRRRLLESEARCAAHGHAPIR